MQCFKHEGGIFIKETCVDYLDVDERATFSSSERKWITKIMKLKELYPDQVTIRCDPVTNDGELVAYIPKQWLKLTPPRKVVYTDEQREAMAERLRGLRKSPVAPESEEVEMENEEDD